MTGDRFYFSPDVHRCVLRDGNFYTEYGEVIPDAPGHAIRLMPVDEFENYADWSDEKRADVLAEFQKSCKAQEAKEKAWREEADRLVALARAKLTEQEFDAVCGYYRNYGVWP